MNQLQITYFLHLCRTLNITETARQLYVAQPSVSKQLASLEKELGYKLFDRTNRGLTLTGSGEIMYHFFDNFSEQFRLADMEARQKAEDRAEEITIGILDNLDLTELFTVIREIQAENAGIQINLIRHGNDQLMNRLKNRKIDMAITFDHALKHVDGVCSEALIHEQCYFIIAKMHRLCRKKDLTPEDLTGEVFCHSWAPDRNEDEYLGALLKKLDIKPKKVITVENLESGLESIIANGMIGLIDERIMLPYPERFRKIPTGVYQDIVIVWDEKNRNPMIPQVVSRLKKQCVRGDVSNDI